MSGITSSTGLISGINSGAIIDQLLAVEGRPKILIQQRVAQLQTQQAAYLDLNSKLNALKTAAQKLRLNKLFDSAKVSSSNADALAGTATAGAPAGNYSFIIDRLVSTHQLLSQGFVDRGTSGTGVTALTFESNQARLDSNAQLSSLNGGAGVARGKIIVTNRAGTSTTIDLSRTASISEVLSAFNDNADAHVSAAISGGKLVLTDTSGGTGTLAVRSASGYTTAESLGLTQTASGNTLTGSLISYVGDNTTIQSLNDGLGLRFNTSAGTTTEDFKITAKDGTVINVDIGAIYATDGTQTASPVTTIAQLKARVASQSSGKITVTTSTDGSGIRFVDNTGGTGNIVVQDVSGAAADLGLVPALGATANFTGASADSKPLLAALQSHLASTLRGGQGLSATDLSVTGRDGNVYAIDLNASGSVSDLLTSISDQTGGLIKASLDSNGTSIILTDSTGGSGNLIVSGGAATQLGLATAPTGVASSTFTGSRIDRQYVGLSTTLASLNSGRGVGSGTFKITGASGSSKDIIVGDTVKTVGDLIKQLNSDSTLGIRARINDAGNGILVEKDPAFVGADQKITITDTTGAVAKALNLAGTAAATGTGNSIDGSFRIAVAVTGTETLDQLIGKINSAHAGVTASVVTDGSAAAPYRLKLTANDAGDNGQFLVTSSGADLGLSLVAAGQDARVFYGSDDPAKAILIKRNSNTVDGVVEGLRADIKTTSTGPVTLSVSRDTDATVSAIQDFVTAFNTLSSKVADLTSYDATADKRGTLLGDSTTLSLNNELFSTLQGTALGVSGQYQRLGQIGLKVARDNTISIDEDKLRTALQNDPQSVKDVFSGFAQDAIPPTVSVPGVAGATVANTATQGKFTQLGVLEKIGQLVDKYLDTTSGILTARGKNLDDEIANNNARISDYDDRLAAKRTLLENQFAAMESTLASLQSQQSSLAGIAGLK
jgi:flagellar hook-associated protein 2